MKNLLEQKNEMDRKETVVNILDGKYPSYDKKIADMFGIEDTEMFEPHPYKKGSNVFRDWGHAMEYVVEEELNRIKVGDFVVRRYEYDKYGENDLERELSINKPYEVEKVLDNGKLVLKGFIPEVRVEMIKKN